MHSNKIKIDFTDFWKGFDPQNNWFVRFLEKSFKIEISSSPDYLIYSCSSHNHLDFDGIKIFYTPENVRPNFLECDYALGFDFIQRQNYFRLPLYAIWEGLDAKNLIKKSIITQEDLIAKDKFCSLVVSNGKAKERIRFYQMLSEYKKVDSGGRFMNNINGPIQNKLEFLSTYKFNIAFENSSYPGYVTEKIYQPMFVNTIPIYWGSPRVAEDFNPKSFINCHDYRSWDDVIEKIKEIDQDDEQYLAMLNEPWLPNNQLNRWLDEERLANFFSEIFKTEKVPVSRTWRKPLGILERKRRNLIGRFRSKFR